MAAIIADGITTTGAIRSFIPSYPIVLSVHESSTLIPGFCLKITNRLIIYAPHDFILWSQRAENAE